MAWFKKTRKPIAAPAKEKAEPGARGPVGQVSRLRAGHLQQGSRGQPQRLPEVRAPLPASTRPSGCACCSTATWTEHDKDLVSTDPLDFTDTKPYKARLKAGDREHRAEGRRHRRRPAPSTASPTMRRRDGVRLHRRQHGRGRRREDHARHRARHRRPACRWSSSAARAARG